MSKKKNAENVESKTAEPGELSAGQLDSVNGGESSVTRHFKNFQAKEKRERHEVAVHAKNFGKALKHDIQSAGSLIGSDLKQFAGTLAGK